MAPVAWAVLGMVAVGAPNGGAAMGGKPGDIRPLIGRFPVAGNPPKGLMSEALARVLLPVRLLAVWLLPVLAWLLAVLRIGLLAVFLTLAELLGRRVLLRRLVGRRLLVLRILMLLRIVGRLLLLRVVRRRLPRRRRGGRLVGP